MSAVVERLSADEYLALEDRRRTELVGGVLVVNEPTVLHQRTVGAIYAALRAWARQQSGRGVAMLALHVRLDDDNVLAPDVLWFAEPVALDAVRAPRVPELVVEVRSRGTWANDLGPKRRLYEQHGVRELWLVDTAARSILIYRRERGASTFADPVELGPEVSVSSPLLPGFAAPIAALIPKT
jgi:Uma2 family endonuclease